MEKQLLIYGQAHPVSSERHREWSVKRDNNYSFASDVNSVPLMAVEFFNASEEYPVVFAGQDDNIMPVAIFGIREQENLFLNENGDMDAKYIPAFLRRYPFVFSSVDDGDNFTLCIDEAYAGCNQEGLGERLFDSEGERTQYLDNVLEFLKDYQAHFNRTKLFCKKLQELELLEPVGAKLNHSSGAEFNLTGFMAVNREKIKELSGEQLSELAKMDALELLYVHIHSMNNFNSLLERIHVDDIPQQKPAEDASVEEGAVAADGDTTIQ